MGTTKQAASKLVETMVAAGYVERGVAVEDGRQRPVRLTARGQELLASVEAIYDELEHEWAEVLGAAELERLRRDLVRALSDAGGGTLPPVRPTL
jgi:DNA-binding MarR family transcriptional regulator